MTRYAVFISVAEYDHADFRSYRTVHNSAAELGGLFDWSELWEVCPPLVNPAEPKALMAELACVFRKCSAADTLLVYFCGHGEQSRRGSGMHLALRGSEPGKEVTQLALQHLYNELQDECAALTKVLILDCCDCGEVQALRPTRYSGNDVGPTTYVLTALRYGEQLASATRDADDDGYTAFSGALIDIVTDGLAGASDPLTIGEIFDEMTRRLGAEQPPDLISHGNNRLPLVENGAFGAPTHRARLSGASCAELAASWSGTSLGARVPTHVVKHHIRRKIRGSGEACELAHALHHSDGGRALLPELTAMLLVGPEDVPGQAVRTLTGSGCRGCTEFARHLLTDAIEALSPERFAGCFLAFDTSCRPVETAVAQLTPIDMFTAVLRWLADDHWNMHVAGTVDRLLADFATLREPVEVQRLLHWLRSENRPCGDETVLENLVQGLPPANVAEFVHQLGGEADQDGRRIRELVVRKRLPQDVAMFIRSFGSATDTELRALFAVAVAENCSPHWLIRLVHALHSHGLTDGPSAAVTAVLGRAKPSAQLSELLDGLSDCDTDQRGRIEAELRAYLCRGDTEVDEIFHLLSRKNGPDQPRSLIPAVAAERPIDEVIALYQRMLDGGETPLASHIARAVATHRRDARELADFLLTGRVPANQLAGAVASIGEQDGGGRVIAHLLAAWKATQRRGSKRGVPDTTLPDTIAECVPPRVLLEARSYSTSVPPIVPITVLDRVIRTMLDQRNQLDQVDVVKLVANLSAHPSRRPLDVVNHLVNALCTNFLDTINTGLDIDRLADVVADVWQNDELDSKLVSTIVWGLDRAVDSRDNTALSETYMRALEKRGAQGPAAAISRRLYP